MNYLYINKSLVNRFKIKDEWKNRNFYKYLLDNNVAYFLSKQSSNPNKHEIEIIAAGNKFNDRYIKTLHFIDDLCKKNRIEYLLFKTHKHIPEAVDGDIDLFIKKIDFNRFLKLLENEKFICQKESSLKASCNKYGFSKIEPRATISFLGNEVLSEEKIWKEKEKINYKGISFYKTSKELDLFFLILNVLYGPNYFKLYSYIVLKNSDEKKILELSTNNQTRKDLEKLLIKLGSQSTLSKRFPLFPNDLFFIKWWFKKVALNNNLSLYSKLKHILFFFYAKYGYIIFGKLPLRHDWEIKND